jgi:hypothetical protein
MQKQIVQKQLPQKRELYRGDPQDSDFYEDPAESARRQRDVERLHARSSKEEATGAAGGTDEEVRDQLMREVSSDEPVYHGSATWLCTCVIVQNKTLRCPGCRANGAYSSTSESQSAEESKD